MTKKNKQFTKLSTIPNTIFVIVLIVGFGAIIGLWGYEIFEKNKQLPIFNKNISEKTIQTFDFGNDYIRINNPISNSIIYSPILISGKANVFEGTVRIRIKDENENILADDFTTATGSIDKLYPFKKEVTYSNPASQNGIIEVFEENVKDGSEISLVKIPVIFEDFINTSTWKTYRNEKIGFEFNHPPNLEITGLSDTSKLGIFFYIPIKEYKEDKVNREDLGLAFWTNGYYKNDYKKKPTFQEIVSEARRRSSVDAFAKEEDIILSDREAIKFVYIDNLSNIPNDEVLITEVFMQKNNGDSFSIEAGIKLSERKLYEKILNKMLLTFKIIEK